MQVETGNVERDLHRRRLVGSRALAVAAVLVAGCAAQRSEGPLGVTLGLSPGETERVLREYNFCRRGEASASEEIFPECDRPGVGFGDAWVIAQYHDAALVRLARYERWADHVRAEERWNQLVERRGPVSRAAREAIFERQRIPAGTRSWTAFAAGDALVGVYLLQPARPQDPAILEEIIPVRPPPPSK